MKLSLSPRQFKAAVKLFLVGGGCVWWKVGTGKTRIAYKYFAMIAKDQPRPSGCNFLVVCRREAFQDWRDEQAKMNLFGWRTETLEHPDQLVGLVHHRHSTLRCLNSHLQGLPPTPKIWIMSHGKLASLRDTLTDVASTFDAVAFDEGFLYKNAQTKHCKAANDISRTVQNALILSGSMMTARNLEDIYGQLYAINRHQSIGRTLTEFRSKYMFQLSLGTNGRSCYVNRKGASTAIVKSIGDVQSTYFPANNHRRIVTSVRVQPATRAQTNAFERLREDMYLALGDSELTLKNTPSLIIKCQQISDGWIKMGDNSIVSLSSAKLDYLLAQLGELIACGEKVVIWCAFKHSVTLVLQSMQKHFPKVGVYSLTGGTSFNRVGWIKNGRICIATEASGSSINFLKDCSYAIYYSMGFRWLDLQQSQGRTNRHDSQHSACYYYFLQTEGSMDSHVYKIVNASSREERKLIELSSVKSWLNRK